MIKHIKIVSLCLILVFIFSAFGILASQAAIASASATSEPPSSQSVAETLLSSVNSKSHPYILYESSDVSMLKNKIKSGYSKKAYTYVEATAKKYLSASINVSSTSNGIIGRQLQSYVAYLSTYGMLSSNSSYKEKAISLVTSAASAGSVEIYDSINGALAVSDFGYAYALAYDWLYNEMTAEQRALLKSEMEQIGKYIYTNSSALNTWGSNEERRKAWNWNAVTHGALGMIAVSLGSHSDWMKLAIDRMSAYYSYAVDSTGAAMEGLHYIGYAMNTLAVLDSVIYDNTKIELLDYYQAMQKLPEWSMRMTAPYGNEQAAIGQGTKLDNLAATYYIINRYSQSTELWGWERTYNLTGENTFISDYQGNGWNVPAIIFYEDKSLTAKKPSSDLPLVKNYEKGQVLATDSWDNNASMMTFTSGYGYSGCWNHPDNNTFTFFAKGESLVIDLGANYKKSSEHNVVQLDGEGMRYEGGSSMVEGYITVNKNLSNGALYLKGDNSDSYNDSVLTKSTRQIVYMGGNTPYVIAFDYAYTDSSTHKYTTNFYTDTSSEITLANSNCAKIAGGNTGAIAYAFVYSKEGAHLSTVAGDKTLAIVTENNAVAHNQIMLYITENPDGSIPEVSFSTDNNGKNAVTVKYKNGNAIHTDKYTFSQESELVYTSSKAIPQETDYGTIPAEYASAADYPFAVFKEVNGVSSYYGSYSMLYGKQADQAMSAAVYDILKPNVWNTTTESYGNSDAKAIILLRHDYTMKAANLEYFNNLAQAQGTVVFDLGGYSLNQSTSKNSKPIFAYTSKGWNDSGDEKIFPSTFIVKNGNLYTYSKAVLTYQCWDSVGNNAIAKKLSSWQFDNVTFGLINGATTSNLLIEFFEAQNTSGIAPINTDFNNCTFDLNTVSPTSAITLFNNNSAELVRIKSLININGGMILADTLDKVTISTLSTAYGSTIEFGRGINGSYLKLKSSSDPGMKEYTSKEGRLTFALTAESDVYALMLSERTKYGCIPARYTSTESYPYVVFDKNGQFVIATSIFAKDATDSALHCAKSNGSVVLLRRNVEYKDSKYNNLSQANGSITIDLNGFTISLKQTASEPWLYAQKKTQYDTTVTIKNGTILTGKNEIVRFDCWAANGKYTGGCNFNIIFDGVTIGVLQGYSPASIFMTRENQSNAVETNASLTIKNCVIDLTNAPKTTLFMMDDDSGLIDVTVNVSNTTIKGNDLSGVTFAQKLDNTASSVTFADDVKLYASQKSTSATFATSAGTKVFVKTTATDGAYTVYKLVDIELVNYKPKMSLTLDRNLVMNVYVPENYLQSFTFNGETYNASEYNGKTTEIDGATYYVLSVGIPAAEAMNAYKLSATLNVGENAENVCFTFTVIKYASKAIANGNATEKQLAKDVLAYVKAAYVYFNEQGLVSDEALAEAVEAIEDVIGSYKSVPVIEGSANVPTLGLNNVTFVLGKVPAMRFYITEDTSAYKFYISGKQVSTEAGSDSNGNYLDIDVYAYALCETVTYTVNGANGGSYHIRSYYEYAKTQSSEKLVSLVESFWAYLESARAYRSFVTKA